MGQADIPVYPYYKQPAVWRLYAHEFDLWLPVAAMTVTSLLLILYLQQYMSRRSNGFDPRTLTLHRSAIITLFVYLIYEFTMFSLSHNYYTLIANCKHFIMLAFMGFVVVKYTTVFTVVFNLSHINQNAFINPRYKYIGKRKRITLKRFFIGIQCALVLFFIFGIYGAISNAEYYKFHASPNHNSYCTQTMTTSAFFMSFGGDILSMILFSFLFGRNAFECSRRSIKPKNAGNYGSGHLSDVNEYDDDKHHDHYKNIYDDDDPILFSLHSFSANTHHRNDSNLNSSYAGAGRASVTKSVNINSSKLNEIDMMLNLNDDSSYDLENSRDTNVQKKKKSIKAIKEQTLIEAEEIITEEEQNGLIEQQRILKLLWIVFGMYWVNIVLLVTMNWYENLGCLNLMIVSVVLILLNDYEFGSTYWKWRRRCCNWCCCCCTLCGVCYCGEERIIEDDFIPKTAQSYRDNVTDQYSRFTRL